MVKEYGKENVIKVLTGIKNYFKTLYNLDYSPREIINAFNKLSKKYQDLLLKINKNENDKALLRIPYEDLRRELMNNKDDVSNVKLRIKGIEELRKEKEKKDEVKEKEDLILDVFDLLSDVDMSENEKLVVYFKYDGGISRKSSDVASELDLTESEVNAIVGRFWTMVDREDIKKYKKPGKR